MPLRTSAYTGSTTSIISGDVKFASLDFSMIKYLKSSSLLGCHESSTISPMTTAIKPSGTPGAMLSREYPIAGSE